MKFINYKSTIFKKISRFLIRMNSILGLILEIGYDLNSSNIFNLQLRMSDGNGLDFGSISSINAVVPGDDNDFKKPVILQGYYSFFGHKKISLDIGQMDPYAFFDGNNYSDDESETFLNLAFIHNPLLDVGGDLNPGTYGGTPGIHFKYSHNSIFAQLATYGSGLGADFEDLFIIELQ